MGRAESRAYPRHDLFEIDRLGSAGEDGPVGASRNERCFVGFVHEKHDGWREGPSALKLPGELVPLGFRSGGLDDDEVGMKLAGELERESAMRCANDFVALDLEVLLDQAAHALPLVHQENEGPGGRVGVLTGF